jgi:hypothetical protein
MAAQKKVSTYLEARKRISKFWNEADPTWRMSRFQFSNLAFANFVDLSDLKRQSPLQGCQIFLCTTSQKGKYILNDNKIYQKALKIPKGIKNTKRL